MLVRELKEWLDKQNCDNDEIVVRDTTGNLCEPDPVIRAVHPGSNGTGHRVILLPNVEKIADE